MRRSITKPPVAPGATPRRPSPRGERPSAALLVALALCASAAAQAQTTPLQQPQVQPTQPRSQAPAPAELPTGRRDPAASAAAHARALGLARAGDRAGAFAAVEQALVTDPRDAQLRFLRGVLLAESGRRDDAITEFRALTQDFPELPEPYNNLAVLHAGAGDLERARDALEQATRVLPSYGLAFENLGDIHLRLAIRAWENAEYLSPASAPRLRGRLALARELGAQIAPRAGDAFAQPPAPTRSSSQRPAPADARTDRSANEPKGTAR